MCGILGRISIENKHYNKSDFSIFNEALDLQSHRGPDGRGIYENDKFIFGHRRLSIIDLNSHSDQPMISKCGNYILVFNGELRALTDSSLVTSVGVRILTQHLLQFVTPPRAMRNFANQSGRKAGFLMRSSAPWRNSLSRWRQEKNRPLVDATI